MILEKSRRNPTTIMRIGMAFLVLASFARWFLHPGARLSANTIDLVTGLLYGLTIGFLALSVMLRRRRS